MNKKKMGNNDNPSNHARTHPVDDETQKKGGSTTAETGNTTVVDDDDDDIQTATSLHQLVTIVSELRSDLREQTEELEQIKSHLQNCEKDHKGLTLPSMPRLMSARTTFTGGHWIHPGEKIISDLRMEGAEYNPDDDINKSSFRPRQLGNSEIKPERSARSMSSTFRDLSAIDQFREKMNSGDAPTYPRDCYSFLAIYGPLENPKYFFFGLLVVCFQFAFLLYLISASFQDNTEVHNPTDKFLRFIPPNVTALVRATQITALFSYLFFADASIRDCSRAVELFPRFDVAKGQIVRRRAVFASVLRLLQGFTATFAALLLVVVSEKVIDIILNFTALNFISSFDEVAFDLAKWGKYGFELEQQARMIEKRPIPYCLYRKYKHRRHIWMVFTIGLIMLILIGMLVYKQEYSTEWDTQVLRIQLPDGLEPYSGCFEVQKRRLLDRRLVYKSFAENSQNATIQYCEEKLQWIIFEADEDLDLEHCSKDHRLAYSKPTDRFDVSATFDETWYLANGRPLEAKFFNVDGNGEDLRKNCGSFVGDGMCDRFFNKLGYEFDGGDCCAPTCNNPLCGQGGAHSVFEYGVGDGYSHCDDPKLVPITIKVNKLSSSRDRNVLEVTMDQEVDYHRERGVDFWNEDPVPPFFGVDCDGSNVLTTYLDKRMEGESETIMVNDAAYCRVSVRNSTNFNKQWDDDPIWWVNYTIYHGNDTTNEILMTYSGDIDTGLFHRIPDCYFDALGGKINASTAYITSTDSSLALQWLIDNSDVAHSDCDSEFLIERFALGALNFAAPFAATEKSINDHGHNHDNDNDNNYGYVLQNSAYDDRLWVKEEQQCGWNNIACIGGSVRLFSLRGLNLDGTISTNIGLLTNLTRVNYDRNGLRGTIPTEMGMLTKLTGLDIDDNDLTGTIPTELGLLTSMQELDLDENELTGTIPTEFGLMRASREFDLRGNHLTGSIPSEIGLLKNTVTLYLEGNKLSGSIPDSIMTLPELMNLHLAENNMIGAIPTEIGQLVSLQTIDFHRNDFRGTIPTEIGNLTNLKDLSLRGNELTGTIPTEIGKLTALGSLNLCGNSLTGRIPSEIGLLTQLTMIRMKDDIFTATTLKEILVLDKMKDNGLFLPCN